MATKLMAMLVCILMDATAPRLSSAISCGEVVTRLAGCFNYISAGGRVPPACCTGVRGLYTTATTIPARQQVCACIKTTLKTIPGVKPDLFAAIPATCGVNLGYPINVSMDCSKVH